MKRFLNPMTLVVLGVMAFFAITDGRFSNPLDWLIYELKMLPGIIIGLSFHEFAHAAVAYRLGDPTPKQQGRVTVNPAAHFDPFGLICLFFVGFGWGKPVMIDPRYFKKPRRDELLVSLAGVTMNLLLAFAFGALLGLLVKVAIPATASILSYTVGNVLVDIFLGIIQINVVLMIFNLIPVPPLDGFNVITEVFNLKRTELYYKIYDSGMLILMALIIFGVVRTIINYTVVPITYFIFDLFVL